MVTPGSERILIRSAKKTQMLMKFLANTQHVLPKKEQEREVHILKCFTTFLKNIFYCQLYDWKEFLLAPSNKTC